MELPKIDNDFIETLDEDIIDINIDDEEVVDNEEVIDEQSDETEINEEVIDPETTEVTETEVESPDDVYSYFTEDIEDEYKELFNGEEDLKFLKEEGNDIRGLVKQKLDLVAQTTEQQVLTDFENMTGGLISHLLKGGTIDEFKQDLSSEYLKIEDVESDDMAETIIRADLKQSGWSDTKIDKQVNRLKSADELLTEAKEVLPTLKERVTKETANKLKESETRIAEQNKERETQLNTIADNLTKANTDLGFSFDEKVLTKIGNEIKQSKSITDISVLQKINNDLENNIPQLMLLDKLGMLDGDFSYIKDKLSDTKAKNTKKKVTPSFKNKNKNTKVSLNDDVLGVLDNFKPKN